MNEDKVKEILADAQDFDPLTLEFKGIDINRIAKQIADLYKPPEELELSDEEMGHDAGCRKLYGDGSCNCGSERTAKAQLAKARLYYEGRNELA